MFSILADMLRKATTPPPGRARPRQGEDWSERFRSDLHSRSPEPYRFNPNRDLW
ncbi:hypothetical protein OG2516_11606 [Oceanicola granulosus HTCC2516]|uniref:Uncharacterized protein n=1 Tax=Oceanicola granulosus (strain ATCC BAA-861 / DSM 15982 / KCTC 12143 / HTCC2516) TaxID=314256 RepID=Q2CJN2_OCEGH|nr:hypothetical protein [Oceanicola granulosus]EAR53107.1 hypothetical protein OG2516_11606 [Oceanicola granulosus HTCC2516]